MVKVRNRRAVNIVRWIGVALSIASVVFAVLTYFGAWNYLRGDTLLADLAGRLDLSYAEVKRQVRPGDPEWEPLLRVIRQYTHAELPADKQPIFFGRGVAVFSAQTDQGEWTAPTTSLLLMYSELPASKENYRVIGTLQDLHDWIRRDEADFDFLVRTIIFGLLSASVGVFLALRA